VSQNEEENGNMKATIIDMIQQLTTEFRKFKKDVYGENQRIPESMEEWKVDFKLKVSETLSETAGEFESKLNKKIAEVRKENNESVRKAECQIQTLTEIVKKNKTGGDERFGALQEHVATLHNTMARNEVETEKPRVEGAAKNLESDQTVRRLNVKMAEVQASIESWEVRVNDTEKTMDSEMSKIKERIGKERTESSEQSPVVRPTEETGASGKCSLRGGSNPTPQDGAHYSRDTDGRLASQLMDLVMTTFEDLPHQNARAHLNALDEYFGLRSIPPALHLTLAMRSLRGFSVTMWRDAIAGTLSTFEEFRNALLTKYWSQQCQAKVRLSIYQDRYHPEDGLSYSDHLMKYAVKAKHLDPPMSLCEFLSAMREHYSLQVRKAWVVSKPVSL
jgi:hypothetical protein